jgi:hypothetical protein
MPVELSLRGQICWDRTNIAHFGEFTVPDEDSDGEYEKTGE